MDTPQVRHAPEGFGGTLMHPGEPAYDEARRVFNGMIDRKPAVVARCGSAADVAAAVNYARAQGLLVSVYGGGHSVTGSAVCDGGVCIDLRGLRRVTVDAEARTAWVEGGATWGDLDGATAPHGLAVTGGRVPSTGVAGLALGSGSGWLERKYGFTCDSLIACEVVTADGSIVRASETENADLFWGLRGGGGNFGIVTGFRFQLHPVGPAMLGGLLIFPAARAGAVMRFYRDFMMKAPDEVGGAAAFITAPPAPFVPEAARGKPVLGIVVLYVGDVAEGERAFAPLRALGPAVDHIGPMPYLAVQGLLEPGNPHGMRNYWSADYFATLTDEAIDVLVEHGTSTVSHLTQIVVAPGLGAITRVPDDAMAFGQRHAEWNIHYLSMWPDAADDARNIAFTRGIARAMKPWTTGQVYLNFIGDEGADRVRSAFGPEKYGRLQALKRKWDPDNVFRHNQNIKPA